jgi:hypothetical protein
MGFLFVLPPNTTERADQVHLLPITTGITDNQHFVAGTHSSFMEDYLTRLLTQDWGSVVQIWDIIQHISQAQWLPIPLVGR